MGISNAAHQASSNGIAALGAYIAAFTAAAGTTGANEGSGTGYGPRPQTTWAAGAMVSTLWVQTGSVVSLPVPAGSYAELGIFDAATAGNFIGSATPSGGTITISGSGATLTITPAVSG